MKNRFREMSKSIPKGIGDTVRQVYEKAQLDEQDSIKDLPLEQNSDYLSPLVHEAMAYDGLSKNIAENRVIDSLLDAYIHYRDNTTLNKDAREYMSICAVANEYSQDNDTDVTTGNLFNT